MIVLRSWSAFRSISIATASSFPSRHMRIICPVVWRTPFNVSISWILWWQSLSTFATTFLLSRGYRILGFVFVLFFFFGFFRAAPLAYGSSQARGWIRATYLPVYITATATPDVSRVCDPYHSSQPCWILNPLSQGQGLNTHPHG